MSDSTTPPPTVTNFDLRVGTHSYARAAETARVTWRQDALVFWQKEYSEDGNDGTEAIMRQMERGLSMAQMRAISVNRPGVIMGPSLRDLKIR